MGDGRLRVGTFLSSAPMAAGADGPVSGTTPPADLARCRELLAGLDGVDFLHDLDIRHSRIRDGQVLLGDLHLGDLDLYVWHAEIDRRPGGYHLEVLRTLARDTRVVVDPEAFAAAADKYRAHLLLRRAGVRVPETLLLDHEHVSLAEPVLAEWGRAVLKPRWGSFGRGVLFVEDYPTLRDAVGYLHSMAADHDTTLLLERFYDNDPADWVSTTVVGGHVLYGYRKRPRRWTSLGTGAAKVYDPEGEGGETDLCDVLPAHAEQARQAAKALGLPIVGFDMILHEGAPIVVDENTYPGIYPDLLREAGQDLGRELYDVIAQLIDECLRARAAGGSPA
ncbi:hypothetical protein AB0K09_02425 [Streptomyces sp. NPDC049577]|uniref:ATP-grasp domain-containing protein n=1 Tax=Streptomyces sp. NPDC049577 TaxID=3155153 RepID=UPI0034460ED5